jgi:quinol monooxygenase YgiN
MSISLVAALAGTLLGAVGTVVLAMRCSRAPRLDLLAWAIAAAGLTIALGAQALGYRRGFAPTTFRAVQVGAQLIAPVALAWGIGEVAARNLPARFAGRLLLSGLAVVAVVVLGTDPLSSQAFHQTWPAASVYYQFIPNALLKLIAAVTVLTAIVAAIVAAVRARADHGWREAFLAIGAAGAGVLVTEALAVHLPANSAYPALCMIAAGLAAVASVLAGRFAPAALHGAHGAGDSADWGPGGRAGASRAGQYAADDSLGLYAGGPSYRGDDSLDLYGGSGDGGYRAPPAGYGDAGGYAGYSGPGYGGPDTDYDGPVTGAMDIPVTGEFGGPIITDGASGPDTGGFDGPVTGAFDPLYPPNGVAGQGANGDYDRYGGSAAPGDLGAVWRKGGDSGRADTGPDAVAAAALDPAAGAGGEHDTDRLYGQIAIYTLLEHGAQEFDRLSEQVVEQVRAHEPDTLVYVVHAVPSAPLQRILYEVYRDRAAYDEHSQQPYIQKFDVGRRPLVLATNVIELGVRQAKVSPFGPQDVSLPPGSQHPSFPPGAHPSFPPGVHPSLPLGPPSAGQSYGQGRRGGARDSRPPGGRAP